MFNIIKYFLQNSRLNHTILLFIAIMGIFSYIIMPKEMFPIVELDALRITGSYSGASANSLNNFAVTPIEEKLNSVQGIKKIDTTIKNNSFYMVLELEENANKQKVLNDVKDSISDVKRYLPSDMNEPNVQNIVRQRALISIFMYSDTLSKKQLLSKAQEVKNEIMKLLHVSDVNIYGDSDLQIQIILDDKKINMYNLNSTQIVNAIKNLTYMYPVANIKQNANHIYVNANNDKFDIQNWQNTLLQVGSKKVYLSDIADIEILHPENDTQARYNAKPSISLEVYEDGLGDSIKLGNDIKKLANSLQTKDLTLTTAQDRSKPLSQRLSSITANITLGLILVGFSMYILISARISFVIILGIPFSFIIGILVMQNLGYSINMTSLAAMLIALGIVVDDAIIVSENIQRHLDEGYSVNDAVLNGTKQMIMPVCIAAFTTIFAFLPLLFLSGSLGLFVRLIPIVISILILASLIESFLFLPLHAKHILKPKDKVLNWNKVYDIYEKILHVTIKYKKTFLIVFFITMPIVIFSIFYNSKYQFFPRLDSKYITFSAKLNSSSTLQNTSLVAKKYEQILLQNKEKIYLKNISTTIGRYTDVTNTSENIENGFIIRLELYDYKEDNFVNNWINPILSLKFDFEREDEKRLLQSPAIKNQIQKLFNAQLKLDKVDEFSLITRSFGLNATNIQIKLSSKNTKALLNGIKTLQNELMQIKGVSDVANNIKLGQKEYKFSINHYGQSLGITDKSVSVALNSYFSEKEQSNTYDDNGIVKVKTWSKYKDNIDEFNNFTIPLENGTYVALNEVVDFEIIEDFEKIQKQDGQIIKNIYANVDESIYTTSEVINMLKPTLKNLELQNIHVSFGGDIEAKEQMQYDMIKASISALFLIFVTLLINFPSYKSAFIILSVIPFTMLGPLIGHIIMDVTLNSQSIIGMLGLAGVVINDGIVMLDFLHTTKNKQEFYDRAKKRVRPIFITSITTFIGLCTLIFFPSSRESLILQPIAISLGFGIAWGTVLNLIYVPTLYATIYKLKDKK